MFVLVIFSLLFIIVVTDRHSSIFLTDEEMTGEEDLDDDMPELPEVTNIIFVINMHHHCQDDDHDQHW